MLGIFCLEISAFLTHTSPNSSLLQTSNNFLLAMILIFWSLSVREQLLEAHMWTMLRIKANGQNGMHPWGPMN